MLQLRVTVSRADHANAVLRGRFNHHDTDVRAFYADAGAQMAVAELWTEPVRAYLQAEERLLLELATTAPRWTHLVEVGCGAGRFRAWAGNHGLHYDGLDLVAPEESAPPSQQNPSLRSRLHRASVEQLEAVLATADGASRAEQRLILFPFNCFGNLARVYVVAQALGAAGSTTLLSTFLTTAEATRCRLDYYNQCGYTGLEVSVSEQAGVLVTAREGLASFAYCQAALAAFAEFGSLRLDRLVPLTDIAAMAVIAPASMGS